MAEQFTGTPGEYVRLEDTIKGFQEILEGKHDELPEQAFYMVGTIEQAVAKGRGEQGEAAEEEPEAAEREPERFKRSDGFERFEELGSSGETDARASPRVRVGIASDASACVVATSTSRSSRPTGRSSRARSRC